MYTPSFAQERLWFVDKYEDGESSAYNTAYAIEIAGPLNVPAFKRALDEIFRRHDALRTRFDEENGRPQLVVQNIAIFPVDDIDFRNRPDGDAFQSCDELISRAIEKPFRLAQGPLIRGILIRLNDELHVFVIVVHHIIFDGWSHQVFRAELSRLYSDYVRALPPSLEPLPTQYTDFAKWQRDLLTGDVLEGKLRFWKELLASPRATMVLPVDRPRPTLQAFRGSVRTFTLTPLLSQRIRDLGRTQRVTQYVTLVAAFQTLLYRCSGEADVIIGTPAANRLRGEYEQLIGYFANTLSLRVNLSDDPTFTSLLSRVRDLSLDMLQHQDTPFELIVAELSPERDLSRNPLFQVMFTLQNVPQSAMELDGLNVRRYEVSGNRSKFDLTVNLIDSRSQFQGAVEYNTDLFDETTIDRLIDHFVTLLESIADNPEEPVSRLRCVSTDERERILNEFNATSVDYPRDTPVHDLVREQAERTPSREAIIYEDTSLSYRQLDEWSNQIAHLISETGIPFGARIGICLDRSPELVASMLGIMKAGCTYVPIDPEFPERRMAYIIEEAGLTMVLTDEARRSKFVKHRIQCVCMEREASLIAEQSTMPMNSSVSGESLAYIMFTSGSTGRPKGVKIPHRAFVNFLSSMKHAPGFTAQDVILSIATPSFDIAGYELLLPLIVGGRVVLLPGKVAHNGALIADALQQHAVTVLQATPVTWRIMLESGWTGKSGLKMLSVGEKLPRDLAESLIDKGAELWNMYGPTETTIYSAIDHVRSVHGPISIGTPVANTQLYVLDQHLEPVPIGVEGMLFIGGDGVAEGYVGSPDLTATAFLDNPFGEGRLYKTGDYAKWLADGRLICLGRQDSQIKLRGFRIELSEIELAINEQDGVQSSVVIVHDGDASSSRLVAYVVSDIHLDTSTLLEGIRKTLPEYMIPSQFMYLSELPVSPNGKIDRNALPDPEEFRLDLHQRYKAPRTETEKVLSDIWCEVLRIDRVGVEDGFFDLGGHSLNATQVQSRVRESLRKAVPLRAIFEHSTLAQLARYIDQEC